MTTIRVRFAETDQMGVAHHSSYVVWLEAARVEWMRHLGLSYRELENEGISMAVASLQIQYRNAAYFDDELLIDTRLTTLKSRYGQFSYRIEGPDGHLVATAISEHISTDRTGRAVRLPSAWREALAGRIQPSHHGN